jgi:Uma2 family endonuclease
MPEAALAFQNPALETYYPESDGEPMAETDDHRDEISELVFTLKDYFEGHEDTYVSGNLLVYYEEGNAKKRRAPDIFVVQGVPNQQRRTYRLWEEGQAPVMVIELTSKGTKTEDQQEKPEVYAAMGIEYYFLYDVLGEYLTPSLQGKRLGPDGKYHPLAGRRRLPCPPLGLDLILDDANRLQFVDRETGEVVVRVRLALKQKIEALRQAEKAREQAEERVGQAEERAGQAEERASQEAAARKAEETARKAEGQAAEKRIAELEALLRQKN